MKVAAALLMGVMLAAPGALAQPDGAVRAAHPHWRVESGGGLDHYFAGLRQAARQQDATCLALTQATRGSYAEGGFWLRLEKGQSRLLPIAGAAWPALDSPWPKAALAAASLAAALGHADQAIDLWVRWHAGGYSVGTRGAGGRAFVDGCAALRYATALLLGPGAEQTALVQALMADESASQDALPLPQRLADSFMRVMRETLLLGQGGSMTIKMDALPLGDGPPILVPPVGLHISALYQQGQDWVAVLTADADVPARMTDGLAVFAPHTRFQPAYTIPIRVVAGQGSGLPRVKPAIDLPYGVWVAGRVAAGQVVQHRVHLPQDAQLGLLSDTHHDIAVTVLDEQGQVIANDDDSGDQYNFRLQTPLGAGEYQILIRHCCGGEAVYKVLAQLSQ